MTFKFFDNFVSQHIKWNEWFWKHNDRVSRKAVDLINIEIEWFCFGFFPILRILAEFLALSSLSPSNQETMMDVTI